ncbi:hypothetical protein Lal_00008495 [Lupinus albus]|nr:hypothetical protein Lal_00008495 [Lupinus albus]
MGDLLGSPRVAPLFSTGGSINGLEILKMVFWMGGTDRLMPKMDNYDLRNLIARTHAGAIIPALMHRIPSELRS